MRRSIGDIQPNVIEAYLRTYDVSLPRSQGKGIKLHTTFDYLYPDGIKPDVDSDDIELPTRLASGKITTRFTRIALRRFSAGPLQGLPSTLECARNDLFSRDVLEHELGKEIRYALGTVASKSYNGLSGSFVVPVRISEETVTRLRQQSIDASV